MSKSDPTAELRETIALACRILAMEGLGDVTLGHVSGREPGADRFWMKGAGLGLEEVFADDLVLVDLDGRQLAGARPRHGEYPIHAEVYRFRPEVNAVVHVHPLYSTVFSALDEPLRPITHDGVLFVPPIPCFRETTDLILTRAQGESVARALGAHPALLLQNHGVVVAGRSVREACLFTLFLERATRAQLIARGHGPLFWTSDEEAPTKRENVFNARLMDGFWQYYVRKLARLPAAQPGS